MTLATIDELCINTIRFLAVNAVQKANSGYSRTPMATTPMGWKRYIDLNGIAIGLSRFGASVPGKVIYEKLELTA